MREGYYSDSYFNRARQILERDEHHPVVRMQVFQRSDAVLCGIDEALAILRLCSGRHIERWRVGRRLAKPARARLVRRRSHRTV